MSFQIHTPVSQRVLASLRQRVFFKLAQTACVHAEKKKGERLDEREVDDIMEGLRAKLEKDGFFKSGAGIR